MPTNLAESIRLRLAGVAERDPSLDLLLKLVAVLGGDITVRTITPVWSALTGAHDATEPVTEVIQRGVRIRLLKYIMARQLPRGAAFHLILASHSRNAIVWPRFPYRHWPA